MNHSGHRPPVTHLPNVSFKENSLHGLKGELKLASEILKAVKNYICAMNEQSLDDTFEAACSSPLDLNGTIRADDSQTIVTRSAVVRRLKRKLFYEGLSFGKLRNTPFYRVYDCVANLENGYHEETVRVVMDLEAFAREMGALRPEESIS